VRIVRLDHSDLYPLATAVRRKTPMRVNPACARMPEWTPSTRRSLAFPGALLGALLANNNAYERVSEFLAAEHLADSIHDRISIGRSGGASKLARMRAIPDLFHSCFDRYFLIFTNRVVTPVTLSQPDPLAPRSPSTIKCRPCLSEHRRVQQLNAGIYRERKSVLEEQEQSEGKAYQWKDNSE